MMSEDTTMLKTFKTTLFLLPALFSATPYADAAIIEGNLAVVGMNSTNPDELILVALADLAAGDSFEYSDNEFNGTSFDDTNEDEFTYTVASPGIAAGTVFSVGVAVPAFSNNGDQVNLYTGTPASPSIIWIFDFDNSNTLAGFGVDVNEGPGEENWEYTGSRTFAAPADAIAALQASSNYTQSGSRITFDLTPFVIPEPASFALVALGGVALLGRRRSA